VITQNNIGKILEDVESGNRDPLNHVSLPYVDYLKLSTWMKAIENYIISSEQYFKEAEDRYKDLQKPK